MQRGADWFTPAGKEKGKEKERGNIENANITIVRKNFEFMCEVITPENETNEVQTGMDQFWALTIESSEEPQSYTDAVNSKYKAQWIKAIEEEFEAHFKNQTWKLVSKEEVPKHQAVMSHRWLFKIKEDSKGQEIFKARLVVRGYTDRNYYDRTETYAPVSRITDVRFLLAIANKFKLEIHQLDIKTAFLNGDLEKPVFMEVPEGYENRAEMKTKYVCKLEKALYGLKVSPRKWYEKFRETMVKINFEIYPFQTCMFTWNKNENFIILLLYVDDILIVGNCKDKIQQTKSKLSQAFEVKDMGTPEKFLGIEIIRDVKNHVMMLHQKQFIHKILTKFGMLDCKPVKTPMITNEGERKSQQLKLENSDTNENVPYRQAIGSLLYLANGTRPDISYAVNALSRKQANYTMEDWYKVKRIFRYLRGTVNLGIKYEGQSENLECYVDASLGTGDEEGRSTTGLIIQLFGDIIFWRTKKQTHVALSSAEAEFIAMSLACKELVCIREMSKRLIKYDVIPIIYEDNNAAINMAKAEDPQSLKHIVKLCYFYVRTEVARRNVNIEWVNTNDQLADFLTKALGHAKFEVFRNKILSDIQD